MVLYTLGLSFVEASTELPLVWYIKHASFWAWLQDCHPKVWRNYKYTFWPTMQHFLMKIRSRVQGSRQTNTALLSTWVHSNVFFSLQFFDFCLPLYLFFKVEAIFLRRLVLMFYRGQIIVVSLLFYCRSWELAL